MLYARNEELVSLVQIVYLENGKVVEAGSHSELLRRGGKYAELWERQASSVDQ
jgi:ABC-type multidrug transport system fused ATPase/permease subunit